jgi:hypothetical protein
MGALRDRFFERAEQQFALGEPAHRRVAIALDQFVKPACLGPQVVERRTLPVGVAGLERVDLDIDGRQPGAQAARL